MAQAVLDRTRTTSDAQLVAQIADNCLFPSHGAQCQPEFCGVIFGLRPPLRPRARAAARPAIVRSPKIGRSYDMHFLPFDPPASNQSYGPIERWRRAAPCAVARC